MSIKATLAQRQKTHGNFKTHAEISQKLKAVMVETPNWQDLSYEQCEALEMIAHKIARLLNGDHTFLDHVVDISGYNELMLNSMKK